MPPTDLIAVADHPFTTEPARLSLKRTTDVLVEIMHERANFHRTATADLPRLVTLISDGDRASLVRAAALIVVTLESLPKPAA